MAEGALVTVEVEVEAEGALVGAEVVAEASEAVDEEEEEEEEVSEIGEEAFPGLEEQRGKRSGVSLSHCISPL